MNKLWIFGDSNSAPFDPIYPYAKQYLEWKGYRSKIYGEVMSEKLGFQHCNRAKPGSDNYTIFQTLCDNVKEMREGDIVIIGWSSVIRFRLLCSKPTDAFLSLVPNWDNNLSGLDHISIETVEQTLINRSDNMVRYVEELGSWIDLIDYTMEKKGVKVVHWSLFGEGINGHQFDIHQPQCCLIDETKGLIEDYHLGEIGHRELSKFLFRYLVKTLV